jgi:hypothetical protein
MTSAPRTALVVMHPGSGGDPTSVRAGETPPDPTDVQQVLSWFREHGFETGPFVGISFAITGPEELFHEVLGDASTLDDGGDEFPLDGLGSEVADQVAAVTVPAPPDFGPGNP